MLALIVSAVPARAARPLPDSGKWDRTFALYARDLAVPWKRITVRLDTYSGAPLDFAAYEVDPADVLIAGSSRARPIDTTRRSAIARWKFTPPQGLRYTPNDVEVPLQNREGFFVIEARRGDAVQQAWLNISRIGLLTKESPGGIVLYGADLGTGKALAGMRITYLVGTAFQYGVTDARGIARRIGGRPRFALAEWGKSKTFVSFLAQPPIPATIVGVRAERAAVRAGERVHVIGFARKRSGGTYRPASGDVRVAVLARGRAIASATARLDGAGAFGAELTIPADAPAGDAAVLAIAGSGSGGAAVHIDGVGDVVLAVAPQCAPCAGDTPISVALTAKRADGTPVPGRDVRVRIVRSPHVSVPGTSGDGAGWGTGQIADMKVRTDDAGTGHVTIPAPSDGLPSTYGILASSGAATASGRIIVSTGRVALAVSPQQSDLDIGQPALVDVRGFDAADGRPMAGLTVKLRVVHGPVEQVQQVALDSDGRGHAVFRDVVPGTNLVYAQADVDGKPVVDVNSVTVAPRALLGVRARRSVEARITTDKPRYRVGERVAIDASLAGALGDAFLDLEGARSMGEQTVPTANGHTQATFTVPETVGDAAIGVAFVRDGALEYATRTIVIDGPGHARATTLSADHGSYAPGGVAHVTIADGDERAGATIAIRLADARAEGGASFDDAAAALAGTGTTTQNLASSDPAWHASVTPRQSTSLDFGANDRAAPSAQTLGAASERSLLWRVDHGARESFDVQLPQTPGRYVVSVLKVSDDGDVGSATLALEVRE